MLNRSLHNLSQEKIPKLVVSYTLTTLSALLFHSIYTLIDSLFVSWGVGDNAMGGVSIIFPFVLLQAAIATALGGGAASLVSRKIGAGRLDEAGNVAFNAMVIFWITAVITTLLGFLLLIPLLNVMGVTAELNDYARDYFTIILLGNLFSTGFSSIIRAEGNMRYGLLIWVIPIAINIGLDAIFILVLDWGVKGSAYATVAGQFTSFCMSILFFVKFSTLTFKGARLNLIVVKEILFVGLPVLIQSIVPALSLLLINNVLKYSSGTLAINTFAYINRILLLAMIPFIALTQAISPIIGYNHGAKKFERVKQTIKFAIILSLFYALIAFAILEIAPQLFLMIFTNNEEIIGLGTEAIRIIAVSIPFTPLAMLMGATYQALGKKRKALLMYSIDFVLLVPCAVFLTKAMGLSGAWWSFVLTKMLTTAFVALFLVFRGKKEEHLLRPAS
ncbi:MAG: MATE family efflux transporter [Chloroflexi bacterium]|nr:MAG: MATE family efflux transporter [Chloroflexota bacterium]